MYFDTATASAENLKLRPLAIMEKVADVHLVRTSLMFLLTLYAQTPLIRFVVDLLYNFSICCGLVVDFMSQGVSDMGRVQRGRCPA